MKRDRERERKTEREREKEREREWGREREIETGFKLHDAQATVMALVYALRK